MITWTLAESFYFIRHFPLQSETVFATHERLITRSRELLR